MSYYFRYVVCGTFYLVLVIVIENLLQMSLLQSIILPDLTEQK